ncbi:protoporphyrinogen oxidase HemJ [Candidatus Neoehrlichia procyonis]|uniref:Protoporphyrinogen IX oxidase n=1 Tax=Candidatus Neoehrlichia procyonis str. RAC413 TaxID=1359163 RepID=A0A0F3NML3_9RICK|nr:protoporphyrinogen oxidase HemJ [Candidatus Neoehrlichia lotoris]KJV69285.1 hypothetical protein NLO413_0671 [Candidatus Neoehrlichia lotoris str. RAC413]
MYEIILYISQYHRWIEAFHVISVIMWMSGMLYLPRLYVYHANVPYNSNRSNMLKVMEHRLLKIIINPAMICSVFFGIVLTITTEAYNTTWFKIKMTFIMLMLIIHMILAKHYQNFYYDKNTKNALYFKIINEIITLIIIIIVIMVVVKPFR